MATIEATIKDVTCVSKSFCGTPKREVWLLACNFAAYTGASDSAQITAATTAVNDTVRDGKTRTLRAAVCAYPGIDTANQAVYTGALTVSTNDLTGNLAVAAGTEITATTGVTTGVGVLAVFDVA